MADGSFPGLVSRNRNVNAADNVVFTGITDDAGNLVSVTGNKLDVNADVTVGSDHVYIDSDVFSEGTDHVSASGYIASNANGGGFTGVSTGDIGIPAMTVDRSTITVIKGGNGENLVDVLPQGTGKTLRVGGSHQDGREFFTIEGDLINVTGGLFDDVSPDNVDEHDVGAFRMDSARRQLNRIVGSTDANRWEIDASGLGQVDVAAHALTNANAWPVSRDNAANTELNPIYVHNTNTVLSGNEIHDYDTAAAVASDAVDNHDYVVTGTTFLLKSVIVSGSGNIKFELQTGPSATLATVAVGFLTGRQGDTKQLFFDPAIEVPITGIGTIRVIRTNRQGAATDLYSTIIGNDVA